MNIHVRVEGTIASRSLDEGEVYEMDLGTVEEYCENHSIGKSMSSIEKEVSRRANNMGDKVLDVSLR